MRQAGRYHRPYQELRKQHRFEDCAACPSSRAEVAMGPIRDFDFDAAILFSDLLFPLEALGMSLSYDEGPPKLDGPLDARAHRGISAAGRGAAARLQFQADAVAMTRGELPADKGLIGFVGGPWTLFVYAMEGSHAGAMKVAKSSWALYREFAGARDAAAAARDHRMQLDAGADVVMMLDTAAGELPPSYFHREVVPDLAALAQRVSRPRRLLRQGLAPRAFWRRRWRMRRGRASASIRAGTWRRCWRGPAALASCRAISIRPGCSCPNAIWPRRWRVSAADRRA